MLAENLTATDIQETENSDSEVNYAKAAELSALSHHIQVWRHTEDYEQEKDKMLPL